MRPKILTFIPYYLPGYKAGGPIRTVANMVDQLGDEFDFRIVAADRDLGDNVPFHGLATNTWVQQGKALVFYRSPGANGWRALCKSIGSTRIDLLYLNSLFSPSASLWPLVLRRFGKLPSAPALLAPRGSLSVGALRLKAAKKRIFLNLAKAIGLYRDVIFHASSPYESRDIKREFGSGKIAIATDLPDRNQTSLNIKHLPAAGEAPRAVFLSRISRMKNLLGALEILKMVSSPLVFDIYGVVEDKEYWTSCEAAIRALPNNIQSRFRREVRPEEVGDIFSDYDFFFLPTLGENYGHAIREALSAGLPALISDRTPWRNLAEKNAGADLPLHNLHAFVDWIERFCRLSAEQKKMMREAAYAYGNDEQRTIQDRESTREMLHSTARGNS